MTKLSVLLTTLCVASVFAVTSVLADIINQENLKTHLRWNLAVPRDQFFVVKRDQTLFIETVNLDLFDALVGELARITPDSQYVDTISSSKDNFPAKPATISVKLKDPTVELFSFYRDADKKYILDFWINTDLVSEKAVALKKPLPVPVEVKKPFVIGKKKAALPSANVLLSKSSILPVVEASQALAEEKEVNPGFRDFRYGASFIWDYMPMIPQLEKDINLGSKIPDSIYPIKDRINLDDPKEAHMQLSINFYREEKYGLMNKSITLYEKKYGRDSNHVTNEFLKVNALLRGNLVKPNRGITQSAMVLLMNIKDMTRDYDLKSAVLRYLLQYHIDVKDHVKTLELAKELYVEARGEFDQNLVIQSALTILHSLAELRQVDKIESFLKENKKVDSILPPQMSLAYLTLALLSRGDTKEIVRKYKLVEKSLAKPIHPAILYNVGESYFRNADYESAAKVYDEFLSSYSYLLQAPHARLRLALAFELMDRPAAENLVLYKNAIDRSTSPEIRYEAKLRYVAMRAGRKLKASAEDRETEIFLEQSPDETKALNQNLKKLLWLVRLRLFISNKEYDSALSYLTSIPLDSMKPAERRVFEGDGAEIIYGLIQAAYLKEDYSKVVKIWEVYKDKYETKVAKNLYMNFVVCDSFIKLGLYKSYDRALASFKDFQREEPRTFPVWVERLKGTDLSQMIDELTLIRLVAESNWTEAEAKLASYPVSLRDSLNYSFYQGLIHLNQKKYTNAVEEFEKVLIKQNPQNQLTPRQTADLLMGYVESLYQLKDQDRFKTVVKALNDDIKKSKSAPILNISERINYLLIEAYAGEENPEWVEIETMAKAFREKFQKSPYSARIGYLYGLSLIKNSKVPEGREVFSGLTNDKTVPSHIKEMCRSELATLELIEKKL
jgi:outer membrane protein assembly factor BamD (BamD/ComL family)